MEENLESVYDNLLDTLRASGQIRSVITDLTNLQLIDFTEMPFRFIMELKLWCIFENFNLDGFKCEKPRCADVCNLIINFKLTNLNKSDLEHAFFIIDLIHESLSWSLVRDIEKLKIDVNFWQNESKMSEWTKVIEENENRKLILCSKIRTRRNVDKVFSSYKAGLLKSNTNCTKIYRYLK